MVGNCIFFMWPPQGGHLTGIGEEGQNLEQM